MSDGLKAFNEHMERKKLLDSGGHIKCPNCKDGLIIKMAEGVYLCDKCKCGITERTPLNISV